MTAESPHAPEDGATAWDRAAMRATWARVALFALPDAMVLAVVVALTVTPAGMTREALLRAASLLCLVALPVGLWAYRPRRRAGWFTLLGAMALWVVAGFADSWTQLHGTPPSVEVFGTRVDLWVVLIALGYGPLILATLLWERARWRARTAETYLDTAMLVLGLGVLGWELGTRPAMAAQHVVGDGGALLMANPMLDVLLLAALARMVTSASWSVSLVLFVSAALSMVISDVVAQYAALTLQPRPLLVNALWFVACAAVTVSVLHPSMRSITDTVGNEENLLTRSRQVVMAVALACPPLTLAAQLWRGETQLGLLAAVTGLSVTLAVIRMAVVQREIQAQAGMLVALATQDQLTALPNRRQGDLALSAVMTAARESLRGPYDPVVVAMIDIDHFQQFNEGLGHLAGDRLLTLSAQKWSEKLLPTQVLARYGGEEFLLISAGHPSSDVADVVRAMRADTPMRQTFSAGIATWDYLESPDALIGRAHGAMYLAKEGGRARTVVTAPVNHAAAYAVGTPKQRRTGQALRRG